jgi:adenylate cyclase
LPDTLKVPLLNELAPDGFFYGGHYIIEFDADSLWYETSLTIAALALKQGMKTEYHVFQHFPEEAREAFSRLGVDAKKLEEEGLLSIWDSFTQTLDYETEKKKHRGADQNLFVSTRDKPLNVKKSAANWKKRVETGYSEEDKRWLHVDDNTSIFLQYNDEKELVDTWRTALLPFGIRARETPHFLGFVRGVASEAFYTKFEALCDGIIDVKAQEEEGRIENYIRVRTLRGKKFDSHWHRLILRSNGEIRLAGTSSQVEERRLAAIMFTDIVGYTALTQSDEHLAMRLLEKHRELIRPILPKHAGREVKTMGDAFLFEFGSALEAIECAVEIQQAIHNYNEGVDDKVLVRVGIHLGDVIHREGDVYGDAVNIASRIEPLASGGGICITQQVYDQVKNRVSYSFDRLETPQLKNVKDEVEVYRMAFSRREERSGPSTRLDKNRIAVLPFANMSPDPNDEYFADGMTEEIISTASGISGLSVISRTSIMGYKGSTKKVGEIGRELNVGSVLEGSVRKSGNRIRVTTQLIDVASDGHLWAQNYDRDLDDVFEVQSDVAKQVADVLRVRVLGPEVERTEKKPTESTTAYTQYLKGRNLFNKRGLDNLKSALVCFELAVKEDPNFAMGYVGQAEVYRAIRNNYGIDVDSNLRKAKEMVATALGLDPGLAEAHATRGIVLAAEYDIRTAEEELKKAIELKPSMAMAHHYYSWLLNAQLRFDEARREIERALELDPLSPIINLNYGNHFFARREYAKAIEPYRRAVELGLRSGHEALAGTYGMLKMFEEMRREYGEWVELESGSVPLARTIADFWIAHSVGDKETIRKLLPGLETNFQDPYMDASTVAVAHFDLDENDKGFKWLEQAYSRREDSVLFIKIWQAFDNVRADSRYLDLVKRLGLD